MITKRDIILRGSCFCENTNKIYGINLMIQLKPMLVVRSICNIGITLSYARNIPAPIT